ncbi:transposase [Planctomicrobium sp. SH661]|uniref:transposase n=1 Tax=Planctomicrobium sp. SH661 TaxID=3448124 RepID=UPI003F5BBE71
MAISLRLARSQQCESPSSLVDRTTQTVGKKEDAHPRRCLGRSRGGLTTKLHTAVSGCGQLLNLILTAGQRGDAPQAKVLLEQIVPGTVGHVVADAAYDSHAIREQSRQLKAQVCSSQPDPSAKDAL